MINRLRPTDRRQLIINVLQQIAIWTPILIGVIHQFLMAFFGIERIYVFVDPPEYISPVVSLEITWWFLLLFFTLLFMLITYLNKLRTINRLVYPLYLYLIFLLIFVKPIRAVPPPATEIQGFHSNSVTRVAILVDR